MKKLLFLVFIALTTFYFTSCEKETPTQENSPDVESNQGLILEDNPLNADVPEATVALKYFPLKKYTAAVTSNPAILEPASLAVTLNSGESVTEHKTLTLPADLIPPRADIMFALDLTSSMGGVLENAKVNSLNIMNELRSLIPDTYFGSISYMDYPNYYSSCGYSATYGGTHGSYTPDYPYILGQGLTSTTTAVEGSINALSLGWGSDGPEAYTRVLWESWNDDGIGWRPGAKRFLINWGDDVPHDCAYGLDCGFSGSTGVDPGRDEVAGTADDLDLAAALQGMADNNITLLALYNGSGFGNLILWGCYAGKTGAGGEAVKINPDGTIPGGTDIALYIAGLVEEAVKNIDNLQLQVCNPEYEGWLVNAGATYTDIYLYEDKTFDFDIEIKVPEGTEDGEYYFEVCAVADGVVYATQEVHITVGSPVGETFVVSLDILPKKCPNPFNMKSKGKFKAAILGTADFDVTQIDPKTVRLIGVKAKKRPKHKDVATPYVGDGELDDKKDCTKAGKDGFKDMEFKFDMKKFAKALGKVKKGDEIVVEITGQLLDGTEFVGYDIIWIKKKKK